MDLVPDKIKGPSRPHSSQVVAVKCKTHNKNETKRITRGKNSR